MTAEIASSQTPSVSGSLISRGTAVAGAALGRRGGVVLLRPGPRPRGRQLDLDFQRRAGGQSELVRLERGARTLRRAQRPVAVRENETRSLSPGERDTSNWLPCVIE